MALGGCGPERQAGRLPEPGEALSWSACLAATSGSSPYRALGKVSFESRSGEIDGDLELRVEPPHRVWAQLRTRALFGLVGERITVLLPGDGYVLTYRERDDRLERWPFPASEAAEFCPGGQASDLVALLTAQIGSLAWLLDPASRADLRVFLESEQQGFVVPTPGDRPPGWLQVRLLGPDPAVVQWFEGDRCRLTVRYDRFVPVGRGRIPTRLEVRAPEAGVRARIRLEEVFPRQGFSAQELEVGTARNPAPRGGVHGG